MKTNQAALDERILAALPEDGAWRSVLALTEALGEHAGSVSGALSALQSEHRVRWRAHDGLVRLMPADWTAIRGELQTELLVARVQGNGDLARTASRIIAHLERSVV